MDEFKIDNALKELDKKNQENHVEDNKEVIAYSKKSFDGDDEKEIIELNEINDNKDESKEETEKIEKIEKIDGNSINENNRVRVEKAFDPIFELRNKATVFGMSQTQLEGEFINYKVERLMKKIDMLISSDKDEGELRCKIGEARKLGFGSVTVTPKQIEKIKPMCEGTTLKINSSVLLDSPEELSKVRIYAAKTLRSTPIDGIFVPLNRFALRFMNQKITEREIKKISKICKGKKVKLLIEAEMMSQSELIALVQMCIDLGIDTIGAKISEQGLLKLKALIALCGTKIAVEVIGNFSLEFSATVLTLGVSKLVVGNATAIGDEMRQKLKNA